VSGLSLPQTLLDLIDDSGNSVATTSDGAVDVGDDDVRFVVRQDAGNLSVEKVQRGVRERVVLRTPHVEAVWRFLTIIFGSELRSRAGWPVLQVVQGADRLPPDCEIDKTGPRRYQLRWGAGGRPNEADQLIEVDAVDLAWTLGHPLDVVVESFRHIDGSPAFPQRREPQGA
jgi:hypothetical protein